MYSTLSRCLRLTLSGRWTTYWQRRISATYRLVCTRRSTRIPFRIFGSGSTPIVVEGDGGMGNDPSCVALALRVWKTQIDRADKLFGALSSEEVLREIAPGRNRLFYLRGHMTAVHDSVRPL